MSARLPTVSAVARRLNIGSRALLAELRRRRILNAENHALAEHVAAGLFRIEQRQYLVKSQQRYRTYWATVVTPAGEDLLMDVAHALHDTRKLHGSNAADRKIPEERVLPVAGPDGRQAEGRLA